MSKTGAKERLKRCSVVRAKEGRKVSIREGGSGKGVRRCSVLRPVQQGAVTASAERREAKRRRTGERIQREQPTAQSLEFLQLEPPNTPTPLQHPHRLRPSQSLAILDSRDLQFPGRITALHGQGTC